MLSLSRNHDFEISKSQLMHLRNAHRRTRSKRKSYRLNALILLGQGWTYQEIAEALLIDVSSIRNYVKIYRSSGIPGLLSDNYDDNASKLTDEEMRILEEHLEEVTYRRVDEIIAYIEEEFDVVYSRSGVTNLLHRLGFSYKKPRKIPGQANIEEQKVFLKKYRKIRKNMGQNDNLLFLDGAHPQHNPLVMSGWIKKGKDKKIYTNTRFHRLNVLGALNVKTHDLIVQSANTLNEETALDFLEKIRTNYPTGKLYLVLDNAGYFISDKFKQYAKSMAIELLYLPPYSPNLNLIERVWLYFQKNVLYNKYYPCFEKFGKACQSFFDNFGKHRDQLKSLLTENFELISAT